MVRLLPAARRTATRIRSYPPVLHLRVARVADQIVSTKGEHLEPRAASKSQDVTHVGEFHLVKPTQKTTRRPIT